MTAKNLLEAVILKTFCFMIGAFPIARNRTITLEVSLRLWLAMTVAGDAGGPVGSVVVGLGAGSCGAVGGGDSDEGVPELDIVRRYVCVFVKN